jgi:hypothetical protein
MQGMRGAGLDRFHGDEAQALDSCEWLATRASAMSEAFM